MSKVNQLLIGTVLTLMLSSQAIAAFTLNGTRFIYEEGKKNLSFEVTNNADVTYGGQIWIDNVTHGKDDVFIVPSPPFFKVAEKQKQIVRLLKVNDNFPKDRESLYWLNVQEVPPKPKNSEGNVLAIAMNLQVKLIYRPKALIEGRKNAERKIVREIRNGVIYLKNPTPYYFAVIDIKHNDRSFPLSDKVTEPLAMFSPFSEVALGTSDLKGKVTIETINDWGGTEVHSLL